MPLRRWTDASLLTFTPQVVAAIVIAFLSVFGAFWASTSGIRSDMRDILTRMESESKLLEVNMKLQEERAVALAKAFDAIQRRHELLSYEVQELKTSILTLKGR